MMGRLVKANKGVTWESNSTHNKANQKKIINYFGCYTHTENNEKKRIVLLIIWVLNQYPPTLFIICLSGKGYGG